MKKDIIMNGEMVDAMQTLQNFEEICVEELIKKSKEINLKYKKNLDEFILYTKTKKHDDDKNK